MSGRFIWSNFLVFPFCCQEVNRHTVLSPNEARLITHEEQREGEGRPGSRYQGVTLCDPGQVAEHLWASAPLHTGQAP